jgi:syntaxin-binding protein 5
MDPGLSTFTNPKLARYGMQGQVSCLGYDPVQSLLAVGTKKGQVHVFGQHNVEVAFPVGSEPLKHIRFVKSVYLVTVDVENNVSVINLETKELVYQYSCHGVVTVVETDPSLDWLFLGLDNGQIIIYDVDRGCQAPYRVGNLQKSVHAKFRMSPVLAVALHPRDVGTLLVCYSDCAVVFSIAKSEIMFSVRYEVPPGSPGGYLDPSCFQQFRYPQFLTAVWHPNGHHILTAHVDGSIVFWDAAEGTLLQARTLMDTVVNMPRKPTALDTQHGGARDPITKVSWNCTANPEETSVLIAGGSVDLGSPVKGLTMLDFGSTPSVAITSYVAMGSHYANPCRHKIFPLPEGVDVCDLLMVARQGPYYAGNHNPSHVIVLLSTGELLTLNYSDGSTVTDPTLLPPALGWINPYVSALSVSLVPRNEWVGMMAAYPSSDSIFNGGAPARRHLRNFQTRTAFCTGHTDGTVKMWDASHGELEDSKVMEVCLQTVLNRHSNLSIADISFAGPIAELAVAVTTGEVVLFDFRRNKRDLAAKMDNLNLSGSILQDISHRAPVNLKEGFLPQTLVSTEFGTVTALKNSNIGFVAVGYTLGHVLVIDKRGPSVIYLEPLSGGSSRRRSKTAFSPSSAANEVATMFEFGIYAINEERFSSVVLSVGTSLGNVYTFRIVPSGGRYSVEMVGALNVGPDPVIHLSSINMERGVSAEAFNETFSRLSTGIYVPGAILAATRSEARVFRQPQSKLSHKKFNFTCLSAGTSYLREGDSFAFVCVTDNSQLRIMAVPNLRDICQRELPCKLDIRYGKDSMVTRTGDIILRMDKTSGALVKIWGKGVKFDEIPSDALYDVLKTLPPRPAIS